MIKFLFFCFFSFCFFLIVEFDPGIMIVRNKMIRFIAKMVRFLDRWRKEGKCLEQKSW